MFLANKVYVGEPPPIFYLDYKAQLESYHVAKFHNDRQRELGGLAQQ